MHWGHMQLTEELAKELRRMYDSGIGKSIVPSLFGILNADRIRTCGSSPQNVVRMAGLPSSYHVEISKGVRLSEYVKAI